MDLQLEYDADVAMAILADRNAAVEKDNALLRSALIVMQRRLDAREVPPPVPPE